MKHANLIPLVLEDKEGRVIRSFRWDEPQLHFVKTSSGRMEAIADLRDLKKSDDTFQVVRSIDINALGLRPIAVSDHTTIRRINREEKLNIIKDEKLLIERDEEYKKSLKASALLHLILFIVGLSFFFGQKLFSDEQVETVVKIELPKKALPVAPPEKKQVVKASKQKIIRTKKVSPKVAKIQKSTVRPKTNSSKVARAKSVNQMGALGALGGSLGGAKGGRGLKLNSALKAPGSGDSMGTKSLGDASVAFAGKGLSVNSGGGGHSNIGQVGYGTKGRSGGQSGYGQMNIGGSGGGGGYEHPMQGGGESDGGLEMSQIEAVIQQNIGQIYYCYERGLQSKPQLNGRVHTQFIINGSGRVQMAQIGKSSLNSATVEQCMVGKIKGWKFPKPHGNVDVNVSYPFTLKRARHG